MRAKKKNCEHPTMNRSNISSWGPSAWTYLHTCSFAYPEDPTPTDKSNMYNFLIYFAKVIPCKRCRIDFSEYLNKHISNEESKPFKNRDSLSRFLVEAHNEVNRKLNKRVVSYEVVKSWYTEPQSDINLLLFVIILIVLGILLFRNKKQQKI